MLAACLRIPTHPISRSGRTRSQIGAKRWLTCQAARNIPEAIAGGKAGLIGIELRWVVVLHRSVEGVAMGSEDFLG